MLHRATHRAVVRVLRIAPLVAVEELVVVRVEPVLVGIAERRLDRERGAFRAENPGLVDSTLLVPDRHPCAVEPQPLVGSLGWDHAAVRAAQTVHVIEDRQPQP